MSVMVADAVLTVCPVCGSGAASPLEVVQLELQHQIYAPRDTEAQRRLTDAVGVPGNRYRMMRCVDCTVEYANPCVAPGSDWYALTYSLLKLYPESRWEFAHVLAQMKKNDVLGEIGCGSGEFPTA
jgi:hypothetical protein